MAKKKQVKETTDFSKYIRGFWMLFGGGILGLVLLFLFASLGFLGEMPDHKVLQNPKTNLASEIISGDGQTLAKIYFRDNRTPVAYEELPKHLVDALVATEDVRFHEHAGIDGKGTLRAFAYAGGRGGASTISQQLARQLFVGVASQSTFRRLTQKIGEWVLAIRLERQFTKEEIIAQYFNIYDFGNNADGIRSAARIYFGKEPRDLDVKESAMLVGMFKNSALYNPRPHKNPEGTLNRRNVVLSQMEKYEFISLTQKDSLQQIPLSLRYTPESHRDGSATYFRTHVINEMKKWVKINKKPDGSNYNLYSDGLKVYTTIDSKMQAYAEDAVNRHMPKLQAEFYVQNTKKRNKNAPFAADIEQADIKRILDLSMKRSERWRKMKYDLKKSDKEIKDSFKKKTSMSVFTWKDGQPSEIDTIMTPMDSMIYYKYFLRPGMMSMDPQTGHVKAWVGGMNYRHFQYDMVRQGKRQVGSTFKPFVYATAIEQLHLSPCDTLPDTQITIEANKYGNPEAWTPKNSGGKYGGTRTLKNALGNSVNTITARLMDKVGPEQVVKMAKNLGIEQDILPVPAIALGTPEISVYEMVAAYSTFANKGVYTKPVFITRIEDKNGTVLFQFTPETKDVLSAETAYVTVKLLEGVTEGGSGSRLRGEGRDKWDPVFKEIITGYPYKLDNPIAGKTGTTQNHSDGWFMGMVPNLVTGVWVGGDDRATRFANIKYGQGAAMALPIWGMYMNSCYEDEALNISKAAFERPLNLSIEVDCDQYLEDAKKKQTGDIEEVPEELDF
jgi:penicillin-binding protein 1A